MDKCCFLARKSVGKSKPGFVYCAALSSEIPNWPQCNSIGESRRGPRSSQPFRLSWNPRLPLEIINLPIAAREERRQGLKLRNVVAPTVSHVSAPINASVPHTKPSQFSPVVGCQAASLESNAERAAGVAAWTDLGRPTSLSPQPERHSIPKEAAHSLGYSFRGTSRYDVHTGGGRGHGKVDQVREVA